MKQKTLVFIGKINLVYIILDIMVSCLVLQELHIISVMHSLYVLLWGMKNTREKKVKFEHLQNFKNQSEKPFYYHLSLLGKEVGKYMDELVSLLDSIVNGTG